MIQTTEITIVDAKPMHYDDVLKLNRELVHFLSPLDLEGLEKLADQSEIFKVVLKDDQVVGFIIALRQGKDYHSVNYVWFEEMYDEFLYVDRVVVSPAAHGMGIGKMIYADLFEAAKSIGVKRVTAEINSRPVNEQSLGFHKSMGFEEVGKQEINEGKKEVSMQMKSMV